MGLEPYEIEVWCFESEHRRGVGITKKLADKYKDMDGINVWRKTVTGVRNV